MGLCTSGLFIYVRFLHCFVLFKYLYKEVHLDLIMSYILQFLNYYNFIALCLCTFYDPLTSLRL